MTAMNFYMPTKVYQEWNAVANHAEEIASFGKKALIVTGRHSSKQNGSLADRNFILWKHAVQNILFMIGLKKIHPSQRLWMQPGSAGNRAQIL